MLWFYRWSLSLLVLHVSAGAPCAPYAHVFLDNKEANQFLTRGRQAITFVESHNKGRIVRECVKKLCSWEEAREIIEDVPKTNVFWAIYVDGNACESHPCAHGGLCKDGIGSYQCFCQTGYQGFNCEIVIPDLCETKNGGCEHFCNVIQGNVQCLCADGYFLASDEKSCHSVIPDLCETKNGGCEHFCNVIQGNVQCSCADGYFLASDEKSCHSVIPDLCETKNGGCEHFCNVIQGIVQCSCADGYFLASDDKSCHSNITPDLCETKNGGCEHFCNVIRGNVQCSCADGYFLASDDPKSCDSNKTYKCGAIISQDARTVFRERQNTTMCNATTLDLINSTKSQNSASQTVPKQEVSEPRINGEDCPPGECPWQALLLNQKDEGFCGGTILNEYIILTAAHCMNQSRYIYVKLGEFDTLVDHGNEATHYVETIVTHNKYRPDTYLNDIALIKLTKPIKFSWSILPACIPEQEFAEKVLMRQQEGLVSGFGRDDEGQQTSTILQRFTMPYVDRLTCIESTQLRISTRMFCAGYESETKDACQGDSGGPHVTRYSGTYFVTGVISCARRGKYGVYTQVSKYIPWIRNNIDHLVSKEKAGK
ncbi:venom prothrombin activator porpharin-D-like [Betta splendens]|uniref:coagulation factor Xa n=1 Tax=Betta splendens TaxID=158456 RepID=A0A6P7LVR8_BETSP|nr:venom prothrombin activator porpharin-D-like [Betta splendens]